MTSFAPVPSPEPAEPLLSTSALAAKLGVHPDTITRSWIPRGCPFEVKLLRGYRFLLSRVMAWLPSLHPGTVSSETVSEISDKVKVAFAKLEARRKGRAS